MATNFPASLDTLTNPTSSDSLSSPSHSAQHANVNDAVEALEAKVGVNSSGVTTSHDYLIAKQSVVPYDDASARTTAVPSPVEGQMSYLKDTNSVEVYDGSAWAAVGGGGGLVLLDQTTVGSAVSSVVISSVFSSTYDNYLVIIAGVIASANVDMNVRFGTGGTFVTTGHYGAQRNLTYAGGLSNTLKNNASSLAIGQIKSGRNDMGISMWVYSPNISDETAIGGTHSSSGNGGYFQGMEIGVNVHTDFLLFPQSGTITGGTVTTYGLVKS